MRWALPVLWLLIPVTLALADGGSALGSFEQDGLRVTVFAAPVPVRAGPMDTTVLVQDARSGSPLTGLQIAFSLRKLSGPTGERAAIPAWCSSADASGLTPAQAGHAKNRLLSGAYLAVPESGQWVLTVTVRQDSPVITGSIPFEALPAQAPFAVWWPMVLLVPAAIGLYAWRSALLRKSLQKDGTS